MKIIQKFYRGDKVKVTKNLGPFMSHFKSGFTGIVMGSYNDLCGGGSSSGAKDYEISYYEPEFKRWNSSAWYHEGQLEKIGTVSQREVSRIKRS